MNQFISQAELVFDLIESGLEQTWLWLTVALVALAAIVGLFVWCFRRDRLRTYAKGAVVFAVGYAVAVLVSGFAFNMIKIKYEESLIPTLFYPILATVITVVLSVTILAILRLVGAKRQRLAAYICTGICAVPLVVSLVYLGLYFAEEIQPGGYYTNVSTLGLSLGVVGLVVIAVCVAIFCSRKGEEGHTRSVVYAGVSIALAFALSYVRLFRMPQGGSITLVSMLPILLYSFRFGPRRGVLVGFVYGLLQALQDPWIIHPAQFLLDYPIGFAMLGIAGFAREKILRARPAVALGVGCTVAVLLRYAAHVLSGIFAFEAYMPADFAAGAVAWGFLYNTYVIADGAIAIAVAFLFLAHRGARRLILALPSVAAASVKVETADSEQVPVEAQETPDKEQEVTVQGAE